MPTNTHDITIGETEVHKRFRHWSDGEAEREWACLTIIATHAPGLAPRPLRFERAGEHPVIVMERLPGAPLERTPLSNRQTEMLGRTLRRMYDIPAGGVTDAGLAERRLGPSTLPEVLRGWLRAETDLSLCQEAVLVREAVEATVEWLTRTDQLPTARPTSLGIADLNPANVLWDGETCRLVDFEDGGLTDPAVRPGRSRRTHRQPGSPGLRRFCPRAGSRTVGR